MDQHFATLDQALPGVSDEHVHIDAPVFGRQAFKDLAVAQGKLQRTEAGSKRRARAPMVRARSRTAGSPPDAGPGSSTSRSPGPPAPTWLGSRP